MFRPFWGILLLNHHLGWPKGRLNASISSCSVTPTLLSHFSQLSVHPTRTYWRSRSDPEYQFKWGRKHLIIPKLSEWNMILHQFMLFQLGHFGWISLHYTLRVRSDTSYVEVEEQSLARRMSSSFLMDVSGSTTWAGETKAQGRHTRASHHFFLLWVVIVLYRYNLHNHEKTAAMLLFEDVVPTMSTRLQTVPGLTFALFEPHIHIVEGTYDLRNDNWAIKKNTKSLKHLENL